MSALLRDHPFMEEARLIRDLLKYDRALERQHSSIIVFRDPDRDIPRLRAEAAHLERLARLDIALGLWPQEEAP